MLIKGSHCVITGVSGATGHHLREAMTAAGAKVTGTQSPNSRPHPDNYSVDMTDPTAVVSLVNELISVHGHIDIWINVVGGFSMGMPVETTTPEEWNRMWSMNFLTTLHACQAILPHFKTRKQGRLINFGSAAALDTMPLASPYLVSKAAVHTLTRAISLELEGDITCNAILPGVIDTPANRESMPTANFDSWVTPARLSAEILDLLSTNRSGELIVLS